MIVHALEETLDKGLQKEGEVVVSVAWGRPVVDYSLTIRTTMSDVMV
jgi:hypothetical protein